ncbi:MAG: glycosyltransferase family A protein [Cyanobacteria bacterium J06639_14]
MVFLSVVIPTYNRKPILAKCIKAMEQQQFPSDSPVARYEIVVIDDGSTDGTVEWLQEAKFPHVRLYEQDHQGSAVARNHGVHRSQGDIIVFVDSDVIVLPDFLHTHAMELVQFQKEHGNDCVFTYGRIVNTCNFDNPTSEPFKVTDYSRAFFATGNVAIARHWLEKAGLFDAEFTLYGWEDLELGVRLKNLGMSMIKVPEAIGYHWHPPFSLEEVPKLIDQEVQRGRMGVVFYKKHPTWDVRMMIQRTWIHRLLWGLLTLGGRLNEKTMAPFLQWLINQGRPQLALEVARIFLNWYTVQAVYAAHAAQEQGT